GALRSPRVTFGGLGATAADIGPNTAPRGDTPVRRRSTMSFTSQSPSPVSRLDVSDGAYQFCTGIRPPPTSSSLTAPSMLRLPWQALPWPCTLYRVAPS